MIGDIYISDGVEFEVIWNGEEGLIPARDTKPGEFWKPPNRLYNKRGTHTSEVKPRNFQFYCEDHDYGWSVNEEGQDRGCPTCNKLDNSDAIHDTFDRSDKFLKME